MRPDGVSNFLSAKGIHGSGMGLTGPSSSCSRLTPVGSRMCRRRSSSGLSKSSPKPSRLASSVRIQRSERDSNSGSIACCMSWM